MVALRACGLALFCLACSTAETESSSHSAHKFSSARNRSKGTSPAAPRRLSELEPEQVLLGLRGHADAIRNCFDAVGEAGSVRVRWRVDAEGRASGVRAELSSAPAANACLVELVESITFIKANGFARKESEQSARWTFVRHLPQAPSLARRKPRGVVLDNEDAGLSSAEVESVIDAGFGLYAYCYREGLSQDAKLRGKLWMQLKIGKDGRVTDVRDAGSSIADRGVLDCIAQGFWALRFAQPTMAPLTATYSIQFEAIK